MQDIESAFTGDVPANYQQRLVPLIFTDYAKDLARRVQVEAPNRVLETACGTGVVTRELRACLPDTIALVATDLSAPMLAAAGKESPTGIDFQQADATALPFSDNEFAAVVCQFGVMFFPDKIMGFVEALRVLQPGGAFVFNTWDSVEHNPLPAIAADATRQFMPPDSPPFMAAPFSYNNAQQIETELTLAGFTDIHIDAVPGVARAPSAKNAALAMVLGSPLGLELSTQGKQQEGLAAIEQVIIDRYGSDAIAAPMQAIVVTARKPT